MFLTKLSVLGLNQLKVYYTLFLKYFSWSFCLYE